jgi:hypothetical protein
LDRSIWNKIEKIVVSSHEEGQHSITITDRNAFNGIPYIESELEHSPFPSGFYSDVPTCSIQLYWGEEIHTIHVRSRGIVQIDDQDNRYFKVGEDAHQLCKAFRSEAWYIP